MYNEKSLVVGNPTIDRYSIGQYTERLKNNTDSSLTSIIQNASHGKDNGSNWLPAPECGFNLLLRMYMPEEQIVNGTWSVSYSPTYRRISTS